MGIKRAGYRTLIRSLKSWSVGLGGDSAIALSGKSITIGPGYEQTEIGCEGFLGEQDIDIPSRLVEATRFRIDGDQMLLLDEFLLVEATRAG